MTAVVFAIADTPGQRIKMHGGTTPLRATRKTITCDGGTATAGGDALTAAQLGLGSVLFLHAQARGAGFVHSYDYANSKLQTWQSAGSNAALDEANTVAISHTIDVFAIGTE